jgi:hypothetical protein
MVNLFNLKCIDCERDEIPEGHTGMVFLICQDYVGEFVLCSECKLKRSESVLQLELDRRRKLIEAETKQSSKKKKKSSRPGGPNRQGSQH